MSRRRNAAQPQGLSRRDFLWKNACAALTATGMASTISDLRLINAAAADNLRSLPSKAVAGGKTSASSFKALVCIFLFGGNDGNNVLVPTDTATYNNNYAPTRGVLALPNVGQAGGLLPLNPLTSDGHTYGVHPNMPWLQSLFNSGQAAFLANVGSLLAPLTQAQYNSNSYAKPSQLFSHNDQQVEWQTSIEDQASATGWGGRSADLVYSLNGNNNVSMNISLAGANMFLTGKTINEYSVSSAGAISLNSSAGAQTTLNNLLNGTSNYPITHSNLIEAAFTQQMDIAINDAQTLNNAIAATAPGNWTWGTSFPASSLGNQLKMIARLIQAAPTLGHSRQVYFAATGGFDLHGGEGSTGGAQGLLLQDLDNCMYALYKATQQIGVPTGVTQFTASDFSRTFPVNSILGADHGWGNNHIIVGGAVNGQKIYGTYPTLTVGGPNDTTTGRWIPTTSVDQYGATLAEWFGVSPTMISTVFPYIGRFGVQNLGFV